MGTARARLNTCPSPQNKRAAFRATQERLQQLFTVGWTPEEFAQAEAEVAALPANPQGQLKLEVPR